MIDRLGRRKMLIFGSIAEAICAVIAGLVGHFRAPPAGVDPSEYSSDVISGGKVLVAFVRISIVIRGVRVVDGSSPCG